MSEYQKKRDYVQYNPVAAKLTDKPEAWIYGSASGRFVLDPIPQGLKPISGDVPNVGPKGPTLGARTEIGAMKDLTLGAHTESVLVPNPQGLPLPPKESEKSREPENAGLDNSRRKVAKA
jgi:hypothetical protein